jgi:hypothetical protein
MNIHPWEKAGLGVAPFQYVGCAQTVRQVGIMTSFAQPTGSCAYCGAALSFSCYIQDATGAEFTVGDTCVTKLDAMELDAATRKVATKAERALKLAKKSARKAREVARIEAAKNAGPDVRNRLDAEPHPTRDGLTLRDWVGFMFANAGHTGQLKAARVVERYA